MISIIFQVETFIPPFGEAVSWSEEGMKKVVECKERLEKDKQWRCQYGK
jgi:hypothetical protein